MCSTCSSGTGTRAVGSVGTASIIERESLLKTGTKVGHAIYGRYSYTAVAVFCSILQSVDEDQFM